MYNLLSYTGDKHLLKDFTHLMTSVMPIIKGMSSLMVLFLKFLTPRLHPGWMEVPECVIIVAEKCLICYLWWML